MQAVTQNLKLSDKNVVKKVVTYSWYFKKVKLGNGLKSFKMIKASNRDVEENSKTDTGLRKLYIIF